MPGLTNRDHAESWLRRFRDAEEIADPFSTQERLLTAQEVANRLGVSERWVRDHATRRFPRIRAVKLGPLIRFRWADVEKFVAAQSTDGLEYQKPR